MSGQEQLFSANLATNAVYNTGRVPEAAAAR